MTQGEEFTCMCSSLTCIIRALAGHVVRISLRCARGSSFDFIGNEYLEVVEGCEDGTV